MTDDKGPDEKILAVPHPKLTAYYDKIATYHDLPDILIQKITHFFTHYKDLETGKWSQVEGWSGVEKARELIAQSVDAAKKARRRLETTGTEDFHLRHRHHTDMSAEQVSDLFEDWTNLHLIAN
eukprot:CAMPEP_0184468860 /NCGR_PEP_ID=MMETSP0740-20130409/81817_1 /TAXON_ID=385413 /ORGANISM="Thalassiosira miniscula, Strain CCMP1093" /LENGTH=123 /DNA_ID=CAMNT_0026844593 /DNA_START=167 /DNA_END=539 /DNA_ORIENTATION=-